MKWQFLCTCGIPCFDFCLASHACLAASIWELVHDHEKTYLERYINTETDTINISNICISNFEIQCRCGIFYFEDPLFFFFYSIQGKDDKVSYQYNKHYQQIFYTTNIHHHFECFSHDRNKTTGQVHDRLSQQKLVPYSQHP